MHGMSTRAGASAPRDAPREGQTFGGQSLLARYASFVRLPHTLFALPFAGLGAVLASHRPDAAVGAGTVLWIVIAFTAARFAAMGFNRIIDERFDALNPRTRGRELPSGRLTRRQASVAVTIAAMLFVLAAFRLNPLCGLLAPAALAWVFFYSYTKRFTAWAHHVLGFALGIAPVGGYLAVAGQWSDPWHALPVLAVAVTFWVAGFDIIYAIQDVEFDRSIGLHSLAVHSGPQGAIALARVFHAIAVVLFLGIGLSRLFPVGPLYLAGVALMAILLVYGNTTARRAAAHGLDLRTIDVAFFRTNVAVSMGLFAFTLADRLVAG